MQHVISISTAPGKARRAGRHAHTGTAAQPTRNTAHIPEQHQHGQAEAQADEHNAMTAPAARGTRGPTPMITIVSRPIVSRTAAGSSGSARLGHMARLNGQHSQHSHHQTPDANGHQTAADGPAQRDV